MTLAHRVAPILIAEIVEVVAGEREEADGGQEDGTVGLIRARVPCAADVAGQKRPEQEDKTERGVAVDFEQPRFPLAKRVARLAGIVEPMNPGPRRAGDEQDNADEVERQAVTAAQLESAPSHEARMKASAWCWVSSLSASSGALNTTLVNASASQHSPARTVTLMPPVTAQWSRGLTR